MRDNKVDMEEFQSILTGSDDQKTVGKEKSSDSSDLGPHTSHLGSDSSYLGSDSSDLGPRTSYLGSDSSDLGPHTSHLGSDSSDLGPRTSYLGSDSSDLAPHTSHLGSDSSDLAPRTSYLGSDSSDLGPRTSHLGSDSSDLGPRTSYLGSDSSDLGPHTSYLGSDSSDLGPRTSYLGSDSSDLGPRTSYLGSDSSDLGPRTSHLGSDSSDLGPRTSYLLFFLPLYYLHKGYFDTILAKTRAFYLAFIIITAVFAVYVLISRIKGVRIVREYTGGVVSCYLIFALAYLLSALLSEDIGAAMSGGDGWNVGALAYLAGFILCLEIRWLSPSPDRVAGLILVGGLPFFIIAVLHGAGLDVFSLHKELLAEERFNYISTAGNVDAFAGIVSLFAPLYAASFLRTRKAVYLAGLFAAVSGLSFAGVDSGFIGLFGGLIAILLMEKELLLRQVNEIMMTISASVLFSEMIQKVSSDAFPIQKQISFMLDRYRIALIVFIITVLAELLIRKRFNEKKFPRPWAYIMVAAILVTALTIFLTGFARSENLGNGRIRIWKRALMVFSEGGPVRKLIGTGADRFGDFTSGLTVGGRTVANCHCSLLQHLVCGGLVTEAAYISLVTACLVRTLQGRRASVFFYGLCGYFLQSQLNNPHNMLLGFVSLFLGMI